MVFIDETEVCKLLHDGTATQYREIFALLFSLLIATCGSTIVYTFHSVCQFIHDFTFAISFFRNYNNNLYEHK